MASDIDMASNALLLLGDSAISSFTEGGFGATIMANIYEDTYRDVLSSHPWSFALKEQSLNKLTQSPDESTGYSNAFQLPTDLIRIWQTFDNCRYTIVGDKLYSNLDSILMRYIYKVEESQLPPHFVKAMEYRLASDAAMGITDNATLGSQWYEKYIMQLGRAQAIDSQNRPQSGISDSPYVDVRFNGNGYY